MIKLQKNCISSRLPWEEATAPKGAAAHSLGTTALANSAMSALTLYCWWDGKVAKECSGHQSLYADAENMKLLQLHTLGCLGRV